MFFPLSFSHRSQTPMNQSHTDTNFISSPSPLQPLAPQRLDSAVMHVSCIHAGLFLAKLGRPEHHHCVAALQQYSHAYEEMAERAVEIRKIFEAAVGGEFDFTHMASVVPRLNGYGPHPGFPMEGIAVSRNSHSPAHYQQHQSSPLSQFPMTADNGFYPA